MNILNFVFYPVLVILFSLAAAFSFLSKNNKDALLSSNRDGRDLLVIGLGLALLGVLVSFLDYTAARMLVGIGFTFVAFGTVILVDDYYTDRLFQPVFGVVYTVLAFLVYRAGSLGTQVYNPHALVTLAVPVAMATLLATLSALAFASADFKDRLDQQNGGWLFIVLGLAAAILSPFTNNTALIIDTASIGGLLFTLGLLIAVDQKDALGALNKAKMPVYVLIAVLLLVGARLFF